MSLHQTFQKFPLIIVALNFSLLFVVILPIKFNLKLSRHVRIDMLYAVVLHIFRWSKSYNAGHKRSHGTFDHQLTG